jgi:hypothetical protein
MELKPGDLIPLVWQLHDGATNKFCRAAVRDKDNAAISGSPFTLAHVANGLYTSNAAIMPNSEKVSVQFLTYDDAGFTTPSTTHSIVSVEIALDKDLLAGEVKGVVQSDEVVSGITEDDAPLVGVVEEC